MTAFWCWLAGHRFTHERDSIGGDPIYVCTRCLGSRVRITAQHVTKRV